MLVWLGDSVIAWWIAVRYRKLPRGQSDHEALHSNEKFRVFATEAFRSEKSTETSDYSTEVSVETPKISSHSK